jgi:hypothetical protein
VSINHESWVVDDGNYVMVPNLNEMIFIVALVIRVSAWVPKSHANKKLDFQCGEV